MFLIVWVERREHTRQQFNDLLQFLFESNLEDAVGLVDDQALQVLEHEACRVLRAQTDRLHLISSRQTGSKWDGGSSKRVRLEADP